MNMNAEVAEVSRSVTCFMHSYRAPHRGFVMRHAQHAEDFMLLLTLLQAAAHRNSGQPGTFVELGALDGETLSNTVLLERCFGFRGVLIEANPTNFAQLNATPARRNATRLHSAVCAGGGTVKMSASSGATSTILETASDEHLAMWNINTKRKVTVPCRPLSAIMEEHLPAPHRATFLSLDVEGAEAAVLRTVDPAAFDVILVEWTDASDSQKEKNREVDQRITQAGLQLAELGVDRSSRVYLNRGVRAVPLRDAAVLDCLDIMMARRNGWMAKNETVERRMVELVLAARQRPRSGRAEHRDHVKDSIDALA